MLTPCCICGEPTFCDWLDDDSVFCPTCTRYNFGGQTIPELDPPRVLLLDGLGRRQASARLALRHREDAPDAR